MADTFLNNIDVDRVQELLEATEANVAYFNSSVDNVVKAYSGDLDDFMHNLYEACIKDGDAPLDLLQSFYLGLASRIYFMNEKLEKLGVYADMSKAAAKEVYSKAYLANQVKDIDKKNKTTVAENQATAEMASQYESVVNSIYDHAYKVVKGKIDSAKDMLNTIRKILSVRQADMSMDVFNPRVKDTGDL